MGAHLSICHSRLTNDVRPIEAGGMGDVIPTTTTAWPSSDAELVAEQERLRTLRPTPYQMGTGDTIGGCFVCFGRGGSGPGALGDPGWAAAVAWQRGGVLGEAMTPGRAGASYRAGMLARREGPMLAAAVHRLDPIPTVLLVNATGLDHPRRAGLAIHLGVVLGIPTVGVTHRPLVADGDLPELERGSTAPLQIDGEQVGWWVRTRGNALPLAVSAGWRTDPGAAVEVVLAAAGRYRTPEPLRRARRLAREARAAAG